MADNTAMGTGRHTAAKAAFVLGLLIWGAIGNPDLISPAIAQPATLTKKQLDALEIYTKAVKNFELVLSQRRAQIGFQATAAEPAGAGALPCAQQHAGHGQGPHRRAPLQNRKAQ
jgi:hypothetical protein